MQESARNPDALRRLASLVAGALLLGLASTAAQGEFARVQFLDRDAGLISYARADTDTVGLHRVDSLLAFVRALGEDSLRSLVRVMQDSLLAVLVDSVLGDTNVRVDRYLTALRLQRHSASTFQAERRGLGPRPVSSIRHQLVLDSVRMTYTAKERVADGDIRFPLTLTRSQYRQQKLEASLDRNWEELWQRRSQRRGYERAGGIGLQIQVPGGRQSGFTTIFGKNTVNLRVTGSANIQPGFIYNKSEQQEILGQGSRLDPSFKMDLRLGVKGSIGDKLAVEVDWNTGRQFNYQNQLKLHYTGYEDDVVQSIEAGNVFLTTPSSLIRGGQSLFGIKSEIQMGGLSLTTVASQQEGQSNVLSLDGGAETTEFDRRPTDYSERTHYFLSYYFRNRWEDALSAPPDIILDAVFSGITELEVWKLTQVAPEEKNVRQVVAVVDLGESPLVVRDADDYRDAVRPHPDLDQYSEVELDEELRPGDAVPRDYLLSEEMDRPLNTGDFQVGQYKKLEEGRHYDLDPLLGYITLKSALQESEALAVSFRYLASGEEHQVGDFSSETGGGDNSQTGERIVLKLLKPVNLQQPANLGTPNELNPPAWYLEMRNLYRLGRGLMPSEFVLDIVHEPPGSGATKTLPGITGQETLIQVLGLDRLNEDGANQPDNLFDFLNNYSVIQSEGLLIFPYLEPFGLRMETLINQSGLPEEEKAAAREQYVFYDLYTTKRLNAARNTKLNVYRIQGSFKGGIPSFYDLKAYSGLVPGSVRVTSGGVPLTEGVDFVVDYQGGSVNIINTAYLTSGRDLSIESEENSLFNLQKKTLLGARLGYSIDERFEVGGTIMRMSQKSITDKYRIGEEPISNVIWGIDGSIDLEPRWLTRIIDAIPLLQTKETSYIRVQGEFAQLRPGRALTNAFKDGRRDLRRQGRDYNADEIRGVSYVDDFEGFENVSTLMRPGAWILSSAPVLGGLDGMDDPSVELPNDGRGALGWYTLNDHALRELGLPADPAVSLVSPQAVFPNRESSAQERILTTLDFHFTPHERGPYNYNLDMGAFLDNPRAAWGGMTQRLSEGNTDFTGKNIEFVEFVFQPFPSGGATDPDARLYIDLGRISEEVIPDNKLNTEDGLSTSESGPVGRLARLSTGQQNQAINPIDPSERITEDLGLDGLASFPDNKFEREGGLGTEQQKFEEFLDALSTTTSVNFPEHLAREREKAQRDPSADDYHYFLDQSFFGNSRYYPGGATVQQRFLHFFAGHELNSFEAYKELSDATAPTGNSRSPDSEDFNLNSAADTDNSYFQYELPLNLSELDALADPERTDDYVVNEIEARGGTGTGWYLVRIPVKDFTRRVGGIQDFTLIESIRLWTSGHTQPITLRFATLELVGSQWRTSMFASARTASDVPLPEEGDLASGTISIESVNNEENTGYEIPNGTVRTRLRDPQSGSVRDAKEQSMVLRVRDVHPNRQQAVFHTYTTAVDFLRYSNLRMFLHLDGLADGIELQDEDRGMGLFFMRLGANEVDDYYEIELPLTPSPLALLPEEATQRSDYLWRTNQPNPDPDGPSHIDLNSINLELSALNQLKFQRDEFTDDQGMGFPTDSTFWSNVHSRLQPLIDEFAAPGTRVGIKGTPSLTSVTTIVLGIRNPEGAERVLSDVNVWVNELRVAGYDEKTGMAGLINAEVGLADFGRVRANARVQTDGFGGLQSTLGDRTQINTTDWTVNTQINMDAFMPERFGWSLPVSMEVKSRSSTPRFDPSRGDVRVQSLKNAVSADTTLTSDEVAQRHNEIDLQAQTQSETRSYTARVSKSRSRSPLLEYTIDATNISYSFSETRSRSPREVTRDSWRWNGSLNYRLQVPRARLLYPFWFLRGTPIVGRLGDLTFNYLPSSFDYTMNASRSFSESQQRRDPVRQRVLTKPLAVELPVRQQHRLSHTRRFSLNYNPFEFLGMNMETNTDQSLNAIGADTTFSVILVDSTGAETRLEDTRLRTLLEQGVIDSTQLGVSAFELTGLQTPGAGRILQRIFGRTHSTDVRTESYNSRAGATLRLRLNSPWLSWLDLSDLSYSSDFTWRNGSFGNNTGAQVNTTVSARAGISLRPQDVLRRLPLYDRMEEEQRAAEAASSAKRAQRAKDRAKRRETRLLERQRAREADAAAEADTVQVQPGEEDLPPQEDAPTPRTPEEAAPTDSTANVRRGLRISFPTWLTPKSLLRRAFFVVAGLRDFSLNYSASARAAATNVGRLDEDGNVVPSYSLMDAIFRGRGPSVGYRLGLEKTLDAGTDRVINDRLQVTDQHSRSDNLQGRMSLNPSTSLQISMDWTWEKTEQTLLTYRILQDGTPGADTARGGDTRVSVWAFGSSYEKLFESQLARYRNDCGPDCGPLGTPPDTIYSSVLTNEAIVNDFNRAYLTGSSGSIPFPLPSWRISYSGISNWPLFRSISSSTSLRHGFSGDYNADFRSSLQGGAQDGFTLANGPTVVYTRPSIAVDAARVNKRFQPLIGLDMTLFGSVQTSFSWNQSHTYSLSTTNNVVSDTRNDEITVSASYAVTGLRLPFFKEALNNRINFSLTVSRSANNDRSFYIRRAIEAAVTETGFTTQMALEEPYADILTKTSRIRIEPKISYQFSNIVSADMVFLYEDFIGDSRRLPYTRMEGGFNVRVNFSN